MPYTVRSDAPMRQSGLNWLVILLAISPLAGCGGSKFPLAPVSGQVRLNGEPLANAHVNFTPTAGGFGSTGVTDSEGRYSLKTVKGEEGAVVGGHSVAIRTRAFQELDVSKDVDDPRAKKEQLPPKYNSNTTLTAEVPDGGKSDMDFDLTVP